MCQLNYNKDYLIKNGKPWFPVMGEMHYSRCDTRFWKESLYQMKTGGVDIVSCYTIWIHHEEEEGQYDFTGNKNLRSFVETCKRCQIPMFLRVGPWIHGEVRNGGFPDWIVQKYKDEARTNNKEYLKDVEKWFEKIFEQVKGMFLKDGGPIIGVQVENEYGHCGGLTGKEGDRHMRTLTKMLKKIGFEVPLYTATGWGGAQTGGLLPVMGGYCEAPWDQRLTEIEPSGNYIFTYERNDHNIGKDFHVCETLSFDPEKFPYLTAELGGGLQVTKHRRPVASGPDIGAMSLVKIGSGCNLLGYYMYRGGTNPKGHLSTLQESRETGYLNDLPELSYDFNAPINEYGEENGAYHEIRILSMFLHDFGEELCRMKTYIPEENPLNPENLTDLRVSVRHDGRGGYIFVNNYQRRYPMEAHESVVLKAICEKEVYTFPKTSILDGEYMMLPFHMQLPGAVLKTAMVSPLCKIKDTFFFYGDREPQYEIEGELNSTKLVTLSRKEALASYKFQDCLFITDAELLIEQQNIVLKGRGSITLKVYPESTLLPTDFKRIETTEQGFAVYEYEFHTKEGSTFMTEQESPAEGWREYELDLQYGNAAEQYLVVDYDGDEAELYQGTEKIADRFYTGQKWRVGLSYLNNPKKLLLRVKQLKSEDGCFLERWPEMQDGTACCVHSVMLEQKQQMRFKIETA